MTLYEQELKKHGINQISPSQPNVNINMKSYSFGTR
jgi:hypothetical protein